MKNTEAKVVHTLKESFTHNNGLVIVEINVYDRPYADTGGESFHTEVIVMYEGEPKKFNMTDYFAKAELQGLVQDVKNQIDKIFPNETSGKQQIEENNL